ncbi:MAG: outer membrane beta-barrel protein [Hyphomicrobiales bacterium]|uniref:outer membrane protein n=1 Tax=Aestuariivirga sp. TaxID=2650926 RepID=UPI0035AFA8F9
MKKFAYAASTMLAAVALASAAHAADVSAPVYDWTGFYVGANAGIAWNNSSVNNNVYDGLTGLRYDEFRNNVDGDQTAFTAGGLLGYNYQIDQIVLGVETDFNYLGFSDDNKRNFAFDGLDVTTKSSFEADWFGTIRGRLGFAIDNVLIYGTGGAAYGHMNANGKVTATDGVDTAVWKGSADSTNWGWTVGAGAEYGIDNWSLGLEYLYVDLGDGNWNDSDDTFIDTNLKGSADYAFSTVRATVKYRFQ